MKNEHDIEKQHDLVQSETLRQARETFDQRKTHDRYWFILKLIMGYLTIVILPVVLIFSCYIILNHKDFPVMLITTASTCLFLDLLALITLVWKVILSPKSTARLNPILKLDREG